MKKRIISILLIICMGMALPPVTALATGQGAAVDNAVQKVESRQQPPLRMCVSIGTVPNGFKNSISN